MNKYIKTTSLMLLLTTLLVACGEQKTELGQGSSVVTGSAGPAGAASAHDSLLRCNEPIATVALVENASGYNISSQYNLPNTLVPLIRLIVQQSGCFRVVDRAAGLRSTMQEQALVTQGVVRKNTTLQKGVAYEAQYTITPSLSFAENHAGGMLGGIMSKIPYLDKFSGVAENVKFKEAQVSLLLTDNQTTEQLAASAGSAKITDLGMGGLAVGSAAGGLGMGWSNTNEAKVVVAAFLDAHNKLVTQARMLQPKELPPAVELKK